ncbi:MAG: hypothetical protein HKM89_15305 [Gemmatimonadales bacterium]|nr:hypothetical protein [Gemmatimonadales bacterium]
MPTNWTCPRCDRTFRRVNQRHACGLGNREKLLENRPPALVELYDRLEATVREFGPVEIVTRDRYALFRTTRIFADLTVMRDALRLVLHLGREVKARYVVKVVQGDKRVSHVTKLRTVTDLRVVTPLLREAYELAESEEASASQ